MGWDQSGLKPTAMVPMLYRETPELGEQQQDWKGGSKLKNPGQDWGQSRMIPRCTSE